MAPTTPPAVSAGVPGAARSPRAGRARRRLRRRAHPREAHSMSPTETVVATSTARADVVPTVNDLAIRIGTVNGSGSQSANLVLLRSLHAMGIPCSGKNVFPSNIEGLPTWFHIRASARGYVGHRIHTPVLVCMNAQTAADDVRQLEPGSVCIH